MFKTIISGYLGRDIEEIKGKTDKTEYTYKRLVVGADLYANGNKETHWIDVRLPQKMGDGLSFLKKGMKVVVVGNVSVLGIAKGKDGKDYINYRLYADSVECVTPAEGK